MLLNLEVFTCKINLKFSVRISGGSPREHDALRRAFFVGARRALATTKMSLRATLGDLTGD